MIVSHMENHMTLSQKKKDEIKERWDKILKDPFCNAHVIDYQKWKMMNAYFNWRGKGE